MMKSKYLEKLKYKNVTNIKNIISCKSTHLRFLEFTHSNLWAKHEHINIS